MAAVVTVLGGGFAGLAAVGELVRLGGSDLTVRLVDRRENSVFAPLLPDAVSTRIRTECMLYPLADHCARLGVEFVHATVQSVNRLSGRVETDAGTLTGDATLICLGCENNYHGSDAARRHAVGLKTVEEARAIRNAVLSYAEAIEGEPSGEVGHIVVVGGGYTGFEAASHAAYLLKRRLGLPYDEIAERCPIRIVELADRVLANCSDNLASRALELIGEFGIEVQTGCTVEDFIESGVRLTDGTFLENATVVWAAGVRAGDAVAGIESPKGRGGRLEVDDYLRLPGSARVFAAGDVAAARVPDKEEPLRMAVQFSLAGGRRAAQNAWLGLCGKALKPFRPTDLGYVVPLAPGKGAGSVLGREIVGRAPSWLHYLMCSYRSWGWGNRLNVARDFFCRR